MLGREEVQGIYKQTDAARSTRDTLNTTTTTTRVLKGRLEGRFRDQRGVQTSGNVGSDALVRRHRDAFLLGRARGDGDALKRSIGRFESVFNALIAKRYLGGTSVGFGSGGEPETTSDDVLGELFGTRPRGPGWYFSSGFFFEPEGAAKHAFCAVCDVVSAINRGFS